MLTPWPGLEAWLAAALSGMAEPWAIALALVLTTFLVEDAATAAGLALAVEGLIGWPFAFAAVAGGIAFGDLLLYGGGRLATRVPALRRRLIDGRFHKAKALLDRRLLTAVFMARVIPGLRLVTYTAAGFLGVSFVGFSLLVLLAVTLWTAGLFVVGVAVGEALAAALGLPLAVAVAIPILVIALAPPLYRLIVPGAKRGADLPEGVSGPAGGTP